MPFEIRQLTRDEGPLLRRLRLAALSDAPEQLGEPLDAALARTDAAWADAAPAAYVAVLDSEPVGMVYAFRDPSDASIARLGGMWIAPSARRHGLGLALVHAVRSWGKANAADRVRLWVVPSTPAERLYLRAGFAATGAQKAFSEQDARAVIELEAALQR